MNEELCNSEVIQKTQNMLGKIIKKPQLTKKLLQKPPFRFIYDIVMAVIHETGFMKRKFTGFDLNPDNFKTKELKIAFLDKLIDAINLELDTKIDVNSKKIVAGKEVEKTNIMLQKLAMILLQRKQKSNIKEETKYNKFPEDNNKNDIKEKNSNVLKKTNIENNETNENVLIKVIEELTFDKSVVNRILELFNYLSEDSKNIENEYKQWIQSNKELDDKLRHMEESDSDIEIDELSRTIADQEKQIKIYEDKIEKMKLKVRQNHDDILRIISRR